MQNVIDRRSKVLEFYLADRVVIPATDKYPEMVGTIISLDAQTVKVRCVEGTFNVNPFILKMA